MGKAARTTFFLIRVLVKLVTSLIYRVVFSYNFYHQKLGRSAGKMLRIFVFLILPSFQIINQLLSQHIENCCLL